MQAYSSVTLALVCGAFAFLLLPSATAFPQLNIGGMEIRSTIITGDPIIYRNLRFDTQPGRAESLRASYAAKYGQYGERIIEALSHGHPKTGYRPPTNAYSPRRR